MSNRTKAWFDRLEVVLKEEAELAGLLGHNGMMGTALRILCVPGAAIHITAGGSHRQWPCNRRQSGRAVKANRCDLVRFPLAASRERTRGRALFRGRRYRHN